VGAALATQNLRTQEPLDYSFGNSSPLTLVQLKEIRNNANHLLTISTDEYIYKMQYSGDEQQNLDVPGQGELATYNLNVDSHNQNKPDTNGMNEILDLVKQMGDSGHHDSHGKHEGSHKKHHGGHNSHKQHGTHKKSSHNSHKSHSNSKHHPTHQFAAIQMKAKSSQDF
jgi:hypothetical protein